MPAKDVHDSQHLKAPILDQQISSIVPSWKEFFQLSNFIFFKNDVNLKTMTYAECLMLRAVELSQMCTQRTPAALSRPTWFPFVGSRWSQFEGRCEEFIFATGPEEATCKLLKAGSAAAISNFLHEKLKVWKMLTVVLNKHQSVPRSIKSLQQSVADCSWCCRTWLSNLVPPAQRAFESKNGAFRFRFGQVSCINSHRMFCRSQHVTRRSCRCHAGGAMCEACEANIVDSLELEHGAIALWYKIGLATLEFSKLVFTKLLPSIPNWNLYTWKTGGRKRYMAMGRCGGPEGQLEIMMLLMFNAPENVEIIVKPILNPVTVAILKAKTFHF